MKLVIKNMIMAIGFLVFCCIANAEGLNSIELKRKLVSQISIEQAKVQITLYWEREGRGNRHRGPHHRVLREKTTCLGVLLEGNDTVAAPAACFQHEDFSLRWLGLKFVNGRKKTFYAVGKTRFEDQWVYIAIKPSVTQGLIGLPISKLQEPSFLQKVFER